MWDQQWLDIWWVLLVILLELFVLSYCQEQNVNWLWDFLLGSLATLVNGTFTCVVDTWLHQMCSVCGWLVLVVLYSTIIFVCTFAEICSFVNLFEVAKQVLVAAGLMLSVLLTLDLIAGIITRPNSSGFGVTPRLLNAEMCAVWSQRLLIWVRNVVLCGCPALHP